MIAGTCSCITEDVPTEDPHERRVVRVVVDPSCTYSLHKLGLSVG